MSWAIFFILFLLPIVSSIIGVAFSRKYAGWTSTGGLVLATILSLTILEKPMEVLSFQWLGNMELNWQLDKLSQYLISLVLLVSTLIHLFSIHYMRDDPKKQSYFIQLGCFTSAMIGILAADHLILLFIFWELVGFTSYLLIGFWFEKDENSQAARVGFMTNRIADLFLLAGIILFMVNHGITQISHFNDFTGGLEILTLPCVLMCIGAFGKSAQFPFWTWLPRAMAGPTPVSALIHAATMVTAGVYLLARVSPVFSVLVLDMVLIVGLVTALVGAISAFFQNEFKAVLAYSTISQLGFMFMAIGAGSSESGIFHLWTHAFFKAGLFLSAAVIMNHFALVGNKSGDIRFMGSLFSDSKKLTFLVLLLSAALVGLPFTSGFISKENIITAVYLGSESISMKVLLMLTIALTSAYMSRLLYHICFKKEKAQSQRSLSINLMEVIPLVVLGLGSIGVLYSINPFGHGSWFIDRIFINFESQTGDYAITIFSLLSIVLGGLFGFFFASRFELTHEDGKYLIPLKKGLALDWIYMNLVSPLVLGLSQKLTFLDAHVIDRLLNRLGVFVVVLSKVADLVDKLLVDGVVRLLARITGLVGSFVRIFQAGRVQVQVIWLGVGVLLITFLTVFLK